MNVIHLVCNFSRKVLSPLKAYPKWKLWYDILTIEYLHSKLLKWPIILVASHITAWKWSIILNAIFEESVPLLFQIGGSKFLFQMLWLKYFPTRQAGAQKKKQKQPFIVFMQSTNYLHPLSKWDPMMPECVHWRTSRREPIATDTFSVKSSAPLIIVVSSWVSSPPLPA